jgi:hypothetical protein
MALLIYYCLLIQAGKEAKKGCRQYEINYEEGKNSSIWQESH